jgi:cation:H+ antiporter
MAMAIVAIGVGLVLLLWSADRFIHGAAASARYVGLPPLLIGMVVVGFGTSAPELVVAVLAANQGNPGIALGNAYGSNITNIAFILGVTALISPIDVHSQILRKELPLLIAATVLAASQLWDGELSRMDAAVLLAVFAALMIWSIRQGLRNKTDTLASETAQELDVHAMPIARAVFWLVVGLLVLVASSRLLVWGAVTIAQGLGVSDVVIGLTVVAIGTSLPELASSIIAARKGEHDIALGNVIGSNLFNTLAVVGVAGSIHPTAISPEIFSRDILLMAAVTIALFAMAYGVRAPRTISRREGAALATCYAAYLGYLIASAF